MSDYISRAEVHKTLSLLATEGGTDAKMLLSDAHEFIDALPSADTSSDLISRADAVAEFREWVKRANENGETPTWNDAVSLIGSLPSADAVPKWNCTANFVAEQLDRLRNMTDEERLDFLKRFFSPSAEAVTICEDGTLEVKVPNAHKVGRVLVMDTESHIGGGLFYPDDAVHGFRGGKIPPKEMLDGTVLIPKHQWLEMERELAELKEKYVSADAVQGEWEDREVFNETDDDHIVEEWQSARCSVCGKYHTTPYMYYFDDFNYCPNCGARMVKEVRNDLRCLWR